MDPALAKEVEALGKTRIINQAIAMGDSEVQQFYKDSTILITGGYGFMGKQLLEKIFRSCVVKKVFLLMRPKKNKSLRERLDIILKDPVFDAVKKMCPGFENKICLIKGDIAELRLGIATEDLAAIIAETEIIIHGAATINFEEPLKAAINTNVRGTVEMLNLGKQCKKLKSYVHISTAFAHATYNRINRKVDEQFYKAALTPQLAIEMAETIEEKRLNDITPKLIQNWPNTYTFTKAIGEEAVRQVGSDLPISIVRPAIVIASLLEPSPGWIDMSCAFGPTGLFLGTILGVLHTVLLSENINNDLVPVDLVNNTIILAGYETARRSKLGDFEQKIYTVTSRRNPTSLKCIEKVLREKGNDYMSPKVLYYTFVLLTSNRTIYFMLHWLLHYIPGYIADFVLRMMGRKPIAVKLYTKMYKRAEVFSYFGAHEWIFGDKNLLAMFTGLNETDKTIYNCDLACVDWKDAIICYGLGVRKYIIKDGLKDTKYGVKKHFCLKMLHYSVVTPLFFYLLYKIAMLAFVLVLFGIKLFFSMFV